MQCWAEKLGVINAFNFFCLSTDIGILAHLDTYAVFHLNLFACSSIFREAVQIGTTETGSKMSFIPLKLPS